MGERAFLVSLVMLWIGVSFPHPMNGQSTLRAAISLDKGEYCSGDTMVLTILNGGNLTAKDSVFFLSFRSLEHLDSEEVLLSELHLQIPEGQFRVPLPDTFSRRVSVEFWLSQQSESLSPIIWKESAWVNERPTVSMEALPKLCLNAAPLTLNHGKPAGGRYWGSAVVDDRFYPSELIPALFTISYEYTSPKGCTNIAKGDIEILPIPSVKSFPMSDASFCLADSALPLISGKPKGGYFAGLGVGDSTFYPELAGPGNHQVSYVVEKWGCTDSMSVHFSVLPKPEFKLPEFDPICVGDDTLMLQVSPGGGQFSGPGVDGNHFHSIGLSQGSYTINYDLNNAQCPDQTSFEIELVAMDTPPLIKSNGDSLWIDTDPKGLQWWLDDKALPGETLNYIRPSVDGMYRVNMKGHGACEAFSEPIEWKLTPAIIENRLLSEWSVFPNPAKDYAVISWRDNFEKNSEIRVYTTSGKLVKRQVLPDDANVYVLEVENWDAGIYIAKIKMGSFNTQRKIVVDR